MERFKGGWWSEVDDACSGWPSTVTCVEVKEQTDQHIRDNRRICTNGTTSETSMMERNVARIQNKIFYPDRMWNMWTAGANSLKIRVTALKVKIYLTIAQLLRQG
jgi:hypothetical protein